MRILTALVAATLLGLATPALAATTGGHGGGDHAAEAGHGDAGHGDAAHAADAGHGDDHGEAAHGDGEHGDDHGGHHYYTADDDGDGVANWRDSMNGDQPNELYVADKLVFHFINLLMFFGLIVYFVRRPMQDALRTRALNIRKELTDSAKDRDGAKERHDEVVARLQALEDEIAELHANAKAEAEVEKERIIAHAREEAERIAQAAERNIKDEVARARAALRREAVELAVELAEDALRQRITSDDNERLTQDFLSTLNPDGEANHV